MFNNQTIIQFLFGYFMIAPNNKKFAKVYNSLQKIMLSVKLTRKQRAIKFGKYIAFLMTYLKLG